MNIKKEWDLSPLLKSDGDPEIGKKLEKAKEANQKFTDKWKTRSDYLKDPKILKQVLDDLEAVEKDYGLSGDPGYYFTLRFYQDQANPEVKAKLNKIEELEKQIKNNRKFFTLNISKIPEKEQKKFISSPELKEYKHFLETQFAAGKHLLSEKEEKILSLKETTSHDFWERMTQGLLTKQEKEISLKNKKQTKNFSELIELMKSTDKKTRDVAAKAFTEILDQYAEVAEQEINAILSNKKTNDELRKFPRADSARHLTDDIPTEAVDTLIKTITARFDIAKRYYKLKADLLGVKKMQYHERSVPYTIKEVNYSFEDSVELVKKTFEKLDNEFSEILLRFLEKGQIDVFPKKGKQNGAFCIHLLPTQPIYILLNHTDNLNNVTTLAHEVGHGINAELMNKTQKALNVGTPKSTAEVASTFMEDFVLEELIRKADPEKKLSILMEKLDSDISTIFRQTSFYNFELELHSEFREKGYLSKERVGELFKKHLSSYLGDSVDTSKADNWWIYVPHFRYIFYVYSYVSGQLISKALQRKVRADHSFIEKVKEFLSAGLSDSPKDIFAKLGIDITKKEFWESGLKEVEDLLNETEALAKKLDKI
ncbi:MAG: M3 family oligoendopeptidase [archaeon]